MARLDAGSWRDFERVVAKLLEHRGYTTQLTEHYDRGADVIAEKHGERVAVQVKHGKRVRLRAVEQVLASLAVYGCTRGIVVTNRDFTGRAREAADANKIDLWDRKRFMKELSWLCALCGQAVTDAERRWSLRRRRELQACVYCTEHRPPT